MVVAGCPGREVLRNPDREGGRAPTKASVQNCCAVYTGADIYHNIRDQHDCDLGESDVEIAEPDISEDSDPKGKWMNIKLYFLQPSATVPLMSQWLEI